ncbi:hypothetical protein DFH27DRAFT_521712 [Peziza echinospora]|nr:hypothetical protein DFH27DRAFT_521712 [Peziza echinospora]
MPGECQNAVCCLPAWLPLLAGGRTIYARLRVPSITSKHGVPHRRRVLQYAHPIWPICVHIFRRAMLHGAAECLADGALPIPPGWPSWLGILASPESGLIYRAQVRWARVNSQASLLHHTIHISGPTAALC